MSTTRQESSEDRSLADKPASKMFRWYLVGQVVESESIRHVAIGPPPFQVGRRAELALSLPDSTVSGLHAEIIASSDGLVVRDLNSTNGTFVNGVPVHDVTTVYESDIVQFADATFRVRREAKADSLPTVELQDFSKAESLLQLEALIHDRSVAPMFQPIVRLDSQQKIGYEVLGRSPLSGLTSPREMFQAASQLNLEAELSRVLRSVGIVMGASLPGQPMLFVNTHPLEINDSGLIDSLRAARESNPTQPITLEVHEAAVTEPTAMRELRAALKDLSIRLAYDDFGAGQARLQELVEVPPDFLKFDMALIRRIDSASDERQHMVEALVNMAIELGITPLAEGIEREEEADTCRRLASSWLKDSFLDDPRLWIDSSLSDCHRQPTSTFKMFGPTD